MTHHPIESRDRTIAKLRAALTLSLILSAALLAATVTLTHAAYELQAVARERVETEIALPGEQR